MAEVAANRWTGSPPNGWQVLRRNRVALFSLWLLVLVALTALVIPFLLHDSLKEVGPDIFKPPGWRAADGAPLHLLGTVLREKHVQRLPHMAERLPRRFGMSGESLGPRTRRRFGELRIELVALASNLRQ